MSEHNEIIRFTIDDAHSDQRIDKVLSELLEGYSRNSCAQLIDNGHVMVNDHSPKASYKTKVNDIVVVEPPMIDDCTIEPEAIPLSILYEDHDVIVIDKPKGMVVHPAIGHTHHTLVNALLYHCNDLSGINGIKRPGIVHRLDKDTSGVVIACKHDQSHRYIADQFADHTTAKLYIALVDGVIIEQAGSIDAPIGKDPSNRLRQGVVENGKPAQTIFAVLHRFARHTLVAVRLLTGRTHQIRVHFDYIKHPVTNDPLYGKTSLAMIEGQLLHAYRLDIILPKDGSNHTFTAPLPHYFYDALDQLYDDHTILDHLEELLVTQWNTLYPDK